MLSSDRHHDSAKCNRILEKKHLDQATERDALIVDAGDVFDAMQSKYDQRSSKNEIRAEDVNAAYLDSIVRNAAKDYAPYAARWLLLGKGNHEMSVLDHHGIDLSTALAERMRAKSNVTHAGGFTGWVQFMFMMNKTRSQSIRLKYLHGTGKGAEMTFGVLDVRRKGSYLPDADVVLMGHTHDATHVPYARERLSDGHTIYQDSVHVVRTPGYKAEYGSGEGGYAVERGHPPKPLGFAWLRLYWDERRVKANVQLEVE